MAIHERLKEERLRLGLSQEEFANRAGVSKRAQANYEKGERSPQADYLVALDSAGVDTHYVLTGRRRDGDTPGTPVDTALMAQIAERLEAMVQRAGRRWPTGQLVTMTAEVYNFLREEESGTEVDDAKLERVLRLVVSR